MHSKFAASATLDKAGMSMQGMYAALGRAGSQALTYLLHDGLIMLSPWELVVAVPPANRRENSTGIKGQGAERRQGQAGNPSPGNSWQLFQLQHRMRWRVTNSSAFLIFLAWESRGTLPVLLAWRDKQGVFHYFSFFFLQGTARAHCLQF